MTVRDAPLRRDVRLLGDLPGVVVVVAGVEEMRVLARFLGSTAGIAAALRNTG